MGYDSIARAYRFSDRTAFCNVRPVYSRTESTVVSTKFSGPSTGILISLAAKFANWFDLLEQLGEAWDYPYAGWYQRMLSRSSQAPCRSLRHLPGLIRPNTPDRRPRERELERTADNGTEPFLPLPPPELYPQDYRI